jgi:hypothetical protein
MIIKNLNDEDFVNYKKPSMFIAFPYCTFKCDHEAGCSVCQNSALAWETNKNIDIKEIVCRYINNPITKAIVCGGLEPFDSIDELYSLCWELRQCTDDDIVIYTGYTEEEVRQMTNGRRFYNIPNIIIKYGRFIPNQEKHYDETLGVELASPNQYARRIS